MKLKDESFRLSPCNADLCVFKYEENFGVKLFQEMQLNFPLVELNMSVASKSIFSSRVLDTFEPFPSFLLKQKENRGRSIFGDNRTIKVVKADNKDIERIEHLLRIFPNLKHLRSVSKSEDDVKEAIKSRFSIPDEGLMAYKLATYIVSTNRLHLRELKGAEKISEFSNFAQYIVIDYDSEAEKKFALLKKKVNQVINSSKTQSSCSTGVHQKIGTVSLEMVFERLLIQSMLSVVPAIVQECTVLIK